MLFPTVLIGAGMILAAIFTSLIAFRFGAPLLLMFLCVGLLAGEDGFGLRFDNAAAAYLVGSVALAVILFDSGFRTPLALFRQAALPSVVLATVGVVVTAALTGLAAALAFGLDWRQALLLGTIVSSTDAAAVFFLLRVGGITIRERVRSTLEIESGANDPMAVFLTVTLVEILSADAGHASALGFLGAFVAEIVLGLAVGLVGGALLVRVINRLDFAAGLYPILVLTASLVVFAVAGLIGGSGFLAAYVAGLHAGNRRLRKMDFLLRFQDGMTWLAQIVMFLTFGLLATPSQFPVLALPAAAVAAFLIFVARPLAVWLCLLPFRYQGNETAFLGWVGLRGAVSILLGILPLAAGLPNGQLFFNAAFVVVLISLIVQGWTIQAMARRLQLIVPPAIGPVEKVELELPGSARHELVVYHVLEDSPVGRGERLPRWARPSLIVRAGQAMRYQYAGRIRPGDYLYLFVSERYIRLLDRLFASPAGVASDDSDFFGAFAVDPRRPARELAAAYGANIAGGDLERPIGDFMAERLGGRAEIGDRVACGPIDLIVRETEANGAIGSVGIALEPAPPVALAWRPLRQDYEIVALIRERLAKFGRRRSSKGR